MLRRQCVFGKSQYKEAFAVLRHGMVDSIHQKLNNVEAPGVEACELAVQDGLVAIGLQAGNIFEQHEVEWTAVTVELKSEGKETPYEFAAGVPCDWRSVGAGKTLARWTADQARRREARVEMAIDVGEADLVEVGDVATGCTGSVSVPRVNGVTADVIG